MPVSCDCAPDGDIASLPCRAVHFLWCVYQDYKGIDAFKLCAQLQIPVSRRLSWALRGKAGLFHDEATARGVCIGLPAREVDHPADDAFSIYHELAHYALYFYVPGYVQHKNESEDEYGSREEVWCDNFALAMLLASYGWKPLGLIRQGHAFLRRGETLSGKHHNVLLAHRLRREMRKPRKKGSPSKKPLYLLSNELLAYADSRTE